MSEAGAAVELFDLTRCFGTVTAVDRVNLAIPKRTIFGLLGPNGAGKTTTIRMLTTILLPSAGTANVAGYDVARKPVQVRRHIGYVSQMLSADGALTGYENLLLFARLYGIPRRQQRARVLDALTFMGLREAANALVHNYSGGMIRRLEIAQSMMHRPDVLFLDEPTMGLDPVARLTVWHHLRDLRDQFGTTIVMTTHDMEEADELCELLAIMHKGCVVTVGAPTALKDELGQGATLEDVFVRYARDAGAEPAGYRDLLQTRRSARRLG